MQEQSRRSGSRRTCGTIQAGSSHGLNEINCMAWVKWELPHVPEGATSIAVVLSHCTSLDVVFQEPRGRCWAGLVRLVRGADLGAQHEWCGDGDVTQRQLLPGLGWKQRGRRRRCCLQHCRSWQHGAALDL